MKGDKEMELETSLRKRHDGEWRMSLCIVYKTADPYNIWLEENL